MTDLPGQTLLVANTGGHLQQLFLLDARLPIEGDRLWVTADTAQSRSLLEGRNVVFVPDVGTRQYTALARNFPGAVSLFRHHNIQAAVSTGSGLALAFLPLAAARGISTHYIESATRTGGPSFTGRLLARVPRLNLYTQHRAWEDSKWSYPGSVFAGFALGPERPEKEIRRVVVSLGTSRKYGFRRLIEKLVELIPGNADVLWQTGSTDVSALGINGHEEVPSAELDQKMREADVVIAHAGTGIALSAFVAGKSPVLVPREFERGEHVDNHQLLTAELLRGHGLAVVKKVDELTIDALEQAVGRCVEYRPAAAGMLELNGSGL